MLVKPPLRVPRASYTTLACPPISLAYLGAALREAGVRVTMVDAVGEAPFQARPLPDPTFLRIGLSDDQIHARIPADATVIGVTCMFSEEWPLVREVLLALRRAFPAALLVAGGEHVTAAPELCLRDAAIDVCVLGEGEDTLVDLVRRHAAGADVTGVPGTAVLADGGVFRTNPPRARIRDVDSIPRPAWDLLPLENYLSNRLGFGLNRGRSVPLVVSRGCPYDCTFCSATRMWGRRWTARSPEAVLDEMDWLIRTYGIENFDLYDLTAMQRKDWTVEFATKLIERHWNITWQIPAGTRTEVLEDNIPELLYKSGCRYLAYAPESGSPDVLARIRKRISLDRMKRSMRDALGAGLHVKCNLMVGFPDESRRELLGTVRLCLDLALLGVHDVNIGPFCPYPGCELFDRLAAAGRIGPLDDRFFDMLASYSDLRRTESWSDLVSNRELALYRWSGMALFYGASLALHPRRIATLVHDLATGRQDTRLARALGDIARRYRMTLVGSGR